MNHNPRLYGQRFKPPADKPTPIKKPLPAPAKLIIKPVSPDGYTKFARGTY